MWALDHMPLSTWFAKRAPTSPCEYSHPNSPWKHMCFPKRVFRRSVSLSERKFRINFDSVNTSLITPARAHVFKCLVVKDMCVCVSVCAEVVQDAYCCIENLPRGALSGRGTHTASCSVFLTLIIEHGIALVCPISYSNSHLH